MTRFRLLIIGLLIAFIFLQYRLWFEPGGIIDVMHLKKQLAIEVDKNEALKQRNQAVLVQVQNFENNKQAIETQARNNLGMVKKGEVYYRVVK